MSGFLIRNKINWFYWNKEKYDRRIRSCGAQNVAHELVRKIFCALNTLKPDVRTRSELLRMLSGVCYVTHGYTVSMSSYLFLSEQELHEWFERENSIFTRLISCENQERLQQLIEPEWSWELASLERERKWHLNRKKNFEKYEGARVRVLEECESAREECESTREEKSLDQRVREAVNIFLAMYNLGIDCLKLAREISALVINDQFTVLTAILAVEEDQKRAWLERVAPMLPSIPEQEILLRYQEERERVWRERKERESEQERFERECESECESECEC